MRYMVMCTYVTDDGSTGTKSASREYDYRDDAVVTLRRLQREGKPGERFSLKMTWTERELEDARRYAQEWQTRALNTGSIRVPDEITTRLRPSLDIQYAVLTFEDARGESTRVYMQGYVTSEDMLQGNLTSERLGGLLTKYGKMPSHEVHSVVQKLVADRIASDFTVTADQEIIREAFIGTLLKSESSGHDSCMRNDFNVPADHHPCMAYGGESDLHLAVMRRLSDQQIIARSVVWPARKTFVRTYGINEAARAGIAAWLEAQGYNRTDGFRGAKITLRRHPREPHALIVPYVDGSTRTCTSEGVLVGREGIINVQTAACVAHLRPPDLVACDDCAREVDRVTTTRVVRRERQDQPVIQRVCAQCSANNYTPCAYYGMPARGSSTTVATSTHTRRMWSELAANLHAFRCGVTETYYRQGTFTRVNVRLPTGTVVGGCYELLSLVPHPEGDYALNLRSPRMKALLSNLGITAPPTRRTRVRRRTAPGDTATVNVINA